jgi:hypothetical protein
LARFARALLWISSLAVLWRIGSFAFDGAHGLQWDTGRLAADNAALRACWSAGQFHGCEGSGHIPLFQHLIAFVLGYSGAQAFTIVRAMTVVSFLAFVKMFFLGWQALGGRERARSLRSIWVLCLATSPLLYYAQASFGEMLATTLILTSVVACLLEVRAPWIAAAVALAGVTKEISPPFVFLLCGTALQARENRVDLRRKLGAVLVGSVAAVFLNGAFNFVRFGVPWNKILLGPTIPTVPWLERPGFFLGLWLSPNGGLLFFWPAFVALLVALVLRRPARAFAIPLYGILATLALITAGLAGWWAPFGWICWGPRLLLPWLPACVLILLTAYSKECADWFELRGPLPWVLMGLICVAGLLQFSSLTGYSVVHGIFGPAPGCPVIPTKPEQDPLYYFHCMRTYVWDPRIRVDQLVLSALSSEAAPFTVAYLIALWSWGVRVLIPEGPPLSISQGKMSVKK